MRLTEREWWSLCAAVAEREENLRVRQEEQGERLGHELAALNRALEKLRPLAPAGFNRSLRRTATR